MADVKSISFTRSDNTPNGKSLVELKEVDSTRDYITQIVQDKKIILKPLKITANSDTKCYILTEYLLDSDIVLIDLIYGNLDLAEIKKSKERIDELETLLSRENIDIMTRERLGATLDYYFQGVILSFVEASYKVQRIVETQIKDIFPNKSKPKNKPKKSSTTESRGIFARFMRGFRRYGKDNLDNDGVPKNGLEVYTGEKAEEENVTDFKSGQGIIFYPSGAAIIAGKVCTKFAYCTKDIETCKNAKSQKETIKLNAFLADGVDLIRLHNEEYYRNRFVNQMCVPSRLKNTRLWRYPYIGGFSSDLKFQNDFDILEMVDKLRVEEKYPQN